MLSAKNNILLRSMVGQS